MVISTVGISTMIDFASPILNIIYPIILTQIILSFFNEKIANDNVYRGAAIGAVSLTGGFRQLSSCM